MRTHRGCVCSWLLCSRVVVFRASVPEVPTYSLIHPASFCYLAVTGVAARAFGIWTLLSCTITLLCAVHITSPPLYQVGTEGRPLQAFQHHV